MKVSKNRQKFINQPQTKNHFCVCVLTTWQAWWLVVRWIDRQLLCLLFFFGPAFGFLPFVSLRTETSQYPQFPAEGLVINVLGAVLVALAVLVPVLLLIFRRPSSTVCPLTTEMQTNGAGQIADESERLWSIDFGFLQKFLAINLSGHAKNQTQTHFQKQSQTHHNWQRRPRCKSPLLTNQTNANGPKTKNKEEIKRLLLQELLLRYGYRTAFYDYVSTKYSDVLKAQQIVNNPTEYNKILKK